VETSGKVLEQIAAHAKIEDLSIRLRATWLLVARPKESMGRFAVAIVIGAAYCGLASAWAQGEPAHEAAPGTRNVADLPIWKHITTGTFNNVNAMRAALETAHVHIGDTANEVLGRPAFSWSHTKIESDLVVVAVADLGFGERGASLARIYARAVRLGLELCPAEVAPYLRLQYLQQPVGEILQIAMSPVATYHGDPVDLAVADGGEGLLLVGGEGRSDRIASGAVRFVFVRPRQVVSVPPETE
jgi:hypothetical protein